MSRIQPGGTACFSIKKILAWCFISTLIYPLCLLGLSTWDYLIGEGWLPFSQLHHFVYTFQYGSKRQFLYNLIQFAHGWLWASLLAFAITLVMQAIICLLNNFSPATRRTTAIVALALALLLALWTPGMITLIAITAVLMVIAANRTLYRG